MHACTHVHSRDSITYTLTHALVHRFDASMVLIAHDEGSHSRGWTHIMFSWAEPFSPGLWALVVLTWLVAGTVYWVIEDRCLDEDGRNDTEFVYATSRQNLTLSIFNTCLEFAGAKWHQPRTFAGRLFAFGWCVKMNDFVSHQIFPVQH